MNQITCRIAQIDEFGAAVPDIRPETLKKLGFDFGDVLDLAFSNGFSIENVPYYNGFYVSIGDPVMVAYPNYEFPNISFNCQNFSIRTGVRAGDTVTITLREKAGRKDVMDLRGVAYSIDPRDYPSRDSYANAREFCVGRIAPGKLYRCASPFDHQMHRPEAVSDFLREHAVPTTFSISESEKSLRERYAAMPEYARDIYKSGHVVALGLGSNYFGDDFRTGLVNGLIRAMDQPLPWAIHCLEGKDRTGFVCILLGALMDADYRELLDDYMITYDNYYRITLESDPVRYNGFKTTFIDVYLRNFANLPEPEDPAGHSYREGAEAYLKSGGMTDEQLKRLKMLLNTPG